MLSHHVDTTGIVPFSRYLEMAGAVVESWFDEALDWSFAQMQGSDGLGIPMPQCAMTAPAPSRLGDVLTWRLEVVSIGQSSLDLRVTAVCRAETRVVISCTFVLAETGVIRSRAWPDAIRARLQEYLLSNAAQ